MCRTTPLYFTLTIYIYIISVLHYSRFRPSLQTVVIHERLPCMCSCEFYTWFFTVCLSRIHDDRIEFTDLCCCIQSSCHTLLSCTIVKSCSTSAPTGCASSKGFLITHPASPGGSFRPLSTSITRLPWQLSW
eukprot:sb/3474991/